MTVVGFDDIPVARYVNPPLTTIRVDIAELGRRAFALLLESRRNEKEIGTPTSDCFRPTLVVRNSCGASELRQRKCFNTQPHRAALAGGY